MREIIQSEQNISNQIQPVRQSGKLAYPVISNTTATEVKCNEDDDILSVKDFKIGMAVATNCFLKA
ncbi:hypothetical protein MIR68_004784 [Amoeboaphelidium protococcarum]|nr:hypothetical protein MIR68_004784 [Amoeboaphelidium protococcarum]